MMKKKFADLADSIIEKIDGSKADEFEKIQMRDIIENARSLTNPELDAKDRLQLMAENQFSICSIICLLMIDRCGITQKLTIPILIYKARWAISFAVIVIIAILCSNPAIVKLLVSLF